MSDFASAAPSPDGSSTARTGGRNARCHCGSGLRLKHCCGSMGQAGPPAAHPPARAAALRRALDLHRADRLDDARLLYAQVLAECPDVPDALHMLGVVHLQTGHHAEALHLLRRAADAFDWKVAGVRHNLGLAVSAVLADAARDAATPLWLRYAAFCDARDARRRPFDGRVSVVVPSYNHAAYVVAALDSLRAQTRRPDEVIVVDDGSTDGSVARIRAALAGWPGVARFHQRGNRGAAATLNEAISMSTGGLIGVLNSDDRFLPSRVETMAKAVGAPDAAWGYARVTCIDAAGEPVAPRDSAHAASLHELMDGVGARDTAGMALLAGNASVSTGNLFFTRDLFERLDGFADHRYNHDWDFGLRASLLCEPVALPCVTYEYRLHGANTILESSAAAQAEMQRVFSAFYGGAVALAVPGNPFAPVPAVWGARFFDCVLGAGHASMLPVGVLRDCADRAAAIVAGGAR